MAPTAAAEPSDLMSSLDALDTAEPISAEDDLVIRMNAVSKVKDRKGSAKEKRKGKVPAKGKSPASAAKPRQTIEKKRIQPKRDVAMRP